jgi:hypothetical protein
MSYIDAASLSDIQANPGKVVQYYAAMAADFKNRLGPNFGMFTEPTFHLMFCALVAFEMKPYGSSTAIQLSDCLAAPVLNCGNYPALAVQLQALNWPSDGTIIDFLGWNGGAVGNHAQLYATSPPVNAGVLIDPTIGLFVSCCGYDLLCAGYKFPSGNLSSWFSWDAGKRTALASQGIGEDISAFNNTIISAIENGSYKASDTLYYFRGWAKFLAQSPELDWATPQVAINPPA